MKVTAVIPAAGSGLRMGGVVPKQFMMLRDRPILIHVIMIFQTVPSIGELVVAAPARGREDFQSLLKSYDISQPVHFVAGGDERQDSVRNALKEVSSDSDAVLVHDGVRPLVSRRLIERVIDALGRYPAVVPVLPVKDTLKRVKDRQVLETVPRDQLVQVQTPQGFHRRILQEAHDKALEQGFRGTDDASLVERIHVPVRTVEGETTNLKITTPQDYQLAQILMEMS